MPTTFKPLITTDWANILNTEFEAPYFIALTNFLSTAYSKGNIFPPQDAVFNAFNKTPFKKVKVVIIAQDPYHQTGQANGLAFAVNSGITLPPSLKNIFKELTTDLNIPTPPPSNLIAWADKGVLLLNTILTVAESTPGAHQQKGWEIFTNAVIKHLSTEKTKLVFLLWGKYAQAKKTLINAEKHFILEAAHPSPLSAYNGFFGCKHFSKTNVLLAENGFLPIAWAG